MTRRKTAVTRLLIALSIAATINIPSFAQSNSNTDAPQIPMTEKKPKTTTIHGDTMVDDYFWLREKSNPAVIAHLEAENAYAAAVMKPTTACRTSFIRRWLVT